MFKIICVTDRKSCKEDFLTRIEKIASAKPDRIIFRDKDCSYEDYIRTASEILETGNRYGVPCSMYRSFDRFSDVHMTMPALRSINPKDIDSARFAGVSVHSVNEAVEAEKMGVNYVIAGHIFETDCKKGLAPRGLDFLKRVCNAVKIPVYAIGGISPENISQIVKAGADGACVMSGFMTCGDPVEYIERLRKGAETSEKSR